MKKIIHILGSSSYMPLWVRLAVKKGFSFDFVIVSMGFTATLTFFTGIVYLLPTDTFGLSPSFRWMKEHGGEVFWGVAVAGVGLLGLVSTYLEIYRHLYERKLNLKIPSSFQPDRLFGRWVWLFTAMLWVFIGTSFLVNVILSPGTVTYGFLGVFSFLISLQARKRLEDADND